MTGFVGDLDGLPAVMTPKEVQRVLRVGRNQVYLLVASGRLRHARIGRSVRITKAALLEFLGELAPEEVQRSA